MFENDIISGKLYICSRSCDGGSGIRSTELNGNTAMVLFICPWRASLIVANYCRDTSDFIRQGLHNDVFTAVESTSDGSVVSVPKA